MNAEEIYRNLSLFPTIGQDGNRRGGLVFEQPDMCKKCVSLDCLRLFKVQHPGVRYGFCKAGLSIASVEMASCRVIVNGMIFSDRDLTDEKNVKKRLKTNICNSILLERWSEAAAGSLEGHEEFAETKVKEALEGLHDIETGVSLVLRNAEVIISQLPGKSDDEKINNADVELRALLKSVQLLQRRLSMTTLITNPRSASHGLKRRTAVYKVFHKMVHLYEESAKKSRKRITMNGRSSGFGSCYDSFETIPLVLIDNAVKYALENTEIKISVNDQGSRIVIEVENIGKVVPASEQALIFGKGYRTQNAKDSISKGSGVGLFVATVVAEANGLQIQYLSKNVDSNDIGHNIFHFEVPMLTENN